MIASGSPSPIGDPQQAAVRVGGGAPSRHEAAVFMLLAPCLLYLGSLWIIRPVPLAYLTPALLPLGAIAVKVPRHHALGGIARLRFEFLLLAVIIILSFLSLANSDEPVRAFRILFPCLLCFVLAWHFVALGSVSRQWILAVPRVLIGAALVFSIVPFLATLLLPPLGDYLIGSYRLKCFFENSIQHAIALAVLVPVIVTEFAIGRDRRGRLLLGALLVLFAITLFRSGSKTAMFVSFASGLSLYALIKARSQSAGKTFLMLLAMIVVVLLLWVFGLDAAERVHPTIGGKLRQIAEGGVTNYQSVDSRKLLWEEALRRGKEHWMVGAGAGSTVLGFSHSHNLVLDYFKGIGLFGAAAVVGLSLLIFGRTVLKASSLLKRGGDDSDKRILACYVGASVYVLLNQMSDCFGPSTIGFLWVLYLSGVLAERGRVSRRPRPPAFELWGTR